MKFGQYELLEPIAIGGMAEVFKGRVVAAEGFEKYVAIKRILPHLVADERFVKMLLTEARIHSALSHRNIVQIHDLGISEDGEYFIVLEYVEGYDLRIITEQLAAEREIIPEALSLYIAAEVAEGLHFAHEMRGPDGQPLGLVHRDVTPSNVLISFAGEVKLSDFGLAKRRHDNSVVGSLKGNLAYMSPEQAKQAPLDRRTDIFSLGALLFELLTGRRLREITDEIAGWSQVASGVVPSARQFRPDIPPAIDHLLDVALSADPAHRFPDAAAFGSAIRDALANLNVAVGASDLAALLGVVTPPRRPRNIMMEPSKVIRLGSEAQALHEAIAAPVTPGPVVSPGMTPASPRAIDRIVRFRDPAATPMVEVFPPPESRDPMATPAPAAPLPPARTRGYTPAPPAGGAPRATSTPAGGNRPVGDRPRPRSATPPVGDRPRPRSATPPVGDRPRPRSATPPVGDRPRPRSATPPLGDRPAQDRPRGRSGTPPLDDRQAGPRPIPPTRTQPFGEPPRPQPPRPSRGTGPSDPVGSRGPLYRTPSYGVQRPSGQMFVIGPDAPPKAGPGRGPGAPPGRPGGGPGRGPATGPGPRPGQRPSAGFPGPSQRPSAGFEMPREQRETARIQYRPPRRWGGTILVLVALVAAAAAAVNFYLIPLEVLIAWRNPASLSIATEPNGASLRLDGVPLDRTAPTTVSVRRDRADHVIEATRPGYQPAREVVRYDKAVGLSFLLRLEKDPAAPPPAPQTDRDGGAARGGAGDTSPPSPSPAAPR